MKSIKGKGDGLGAKFTPPVADIETGKKANLDRARTVMTAIEAKVELTPACKAAALEVWQSMQGITKFSTMDLETQLIACILAIDKLTAWLWIDIKEFPNASRADLEYCMKVAYDWTMIRHFISSKLLRYPKEITEVALDKAVDIMNNLTDHKLNIDSKNMVIDDACGAAIKRFKDVIQLEDQKLPSVTETEPVVINSDFERKIWKSIKEMARLSDTEDKYKLLAFALWRKMKISNRFVAMNVEAQAVACLNAVAIHPLFWRDISQFVPTVSRKELSECWRMAESFRRIQFRLERCLPTPPKVIRVAILIAAKIFADAEDCGESEMPQQRIIRASLNISLKKHNYITSSKDALVTEMMEKYDSYGTEVMMKKTPVEVPNCNVM